MAWYLPALLLLIILTPKILMPSTAIAKNIQPINLEQPYFELVDAISKSYEHNFLELPLFFKMTRQSMVDEFKAYLEQLKANKQHLNTQFDTHSGSIKAEELTKILQKAASTGFQKFCPPVLRLQNLEFNSFNHHFMGVTNF